MDDGLQLAEEAFTYLFPLYEMARMRAATARHKLDTPTCGSTNEAAEKADRRLRWANVFVHSRQLLSPTNTKVVTPNSDTLYTAAWLDLRQGPQVIDVPETHGRYYVLGLLDMYTNPFCSVGTRTTGTHSRSFLLTPPGWVNPIPSTWQASGAHIACPTNWVWVIGRILIEGEQALRAVHELQNGFMIRGVNGQGPSQFDPAFSPEFLGPRPPSAGHFLHIVNGMLLENQPPVEQRPYLARFESLGIGVGPGDQFRAPHPHHAALLDSAIATCLARWRDADIGQRSVTGWQSQPLMGSNFGVDYTRRAIVALKYIGALESRDAIYPMAFHDDCGEKLSGEHCFAIRFESHALPPVDSFWSITMYSGVDRMLVPNSLNRFAIGDRTAGLHWGADGSLVIYVTHREPTTPQVRANWLPAPAGNFYLCLRAYVPRVEMLDGSYVLPPVTRLA